jgi:hypothetical protein
MRNLILTYRFYYVQAIPQTTSLISSMKDDCSSQGVAGTAEFAFGGEGDKNLALLRRSGFATNEPLARSQ